MTQLPATIVVVDDDPDIVEILCDYICWMGFDVVSCRPGPHTLDCIAQHAPALVVLDVEMGDTTGIDLFHAIRADSVTRLVPVIFFTANDHALQTGLPDYVARGAGLVVKPHTDALGVLIHKVLSSHR